MLRACTYGSSAGVGRRAAPPAPFYPCPQGSTMTEAVVAQTRASGRTAGEDLAAQVAKGLGGNAPDALIVFASPDQDHGALLQALQESTGAAVMVGCSSAGEFTSDESGTGMTCAVALRASEMVFTASLGRGLRGDRTAAAERMVEGFRGLDAGSHRYRSALVLTDALAGF